MISTCLGIDWIYTNPEENEDVAEQPLVVPPQRYLKILRDLALLGKIPSIQDQSTHLKELDQKFVPFANKLDELAKNFEDEKILALVESYLN